MSDHKIELIPGGIRIERLVVESSETRAFLEAGLETEWPDRLTRAIQVGVVALERALVTQDLHYVRTAVEDLLAEVRTEVIQSLPAALEEELRGTLGAEEGQILHPVAEAVRSAAAKLDDIKKLVDDDLDPAREGSVLHKKLAAMSRLLDETSTESIAYKLNDKLSRVAQKDGTLSQSVKQVVREELEPYKERVNELVALLEQKAGAAGVIQKTTLAGDPFEQEVYQLLRTAFHRGGCQVEWVGPRNETGDVLLTFDEEAGDYKVIVEAKYSATQEWGEKGIATEMEKAMKQYDADYGLFVSSGIDAVKPSVNYWYQGASELGPWLAVTFDDAIEAVRVLRIQHYKRTRLSGSDTVDAAVAGDQLKVILHKIKEIGKAKRALKRIKDSAEDLHKLLSDMRSGVTRAVTEASAALHIEDAGADLEDEAEDDED